MYDYHLTLGLVSVLVGLVGDCIYLWTVFSGRTRPHIFTWIIFSLIDGIIFAAQLKSGGGPGALSVGFGTIANLAVALLSFKRARVLITRADWFYFLSALLGVALWSVTSTPLPAVVLLTFVNALAVVPTFRKSFWSPREESLTIWIFDVVRYGISIPALVVINFTTALFPIGIMLVNGTLAVMILLRRRQLAKIPR